MNHQAFVQCPDQITLNVVKNIVGEDYMKYIGKPIVLDENNIKQHRNIVFSENEDNDDDDDKSNTDNNNNSNTFKQKDISKDDRNYHDDDNEEYDEDFVDINDFSK